MGDHPPTKQELTAQVEELRRRLQAAEAALRDRDQDLAGSRDSLQEMEKDRLDLAAELAAQSEELQAANEELTIQTEELRIQNEELQTLNLNLEVQKEALERLTQELEAERALLRTVLEQMPAGVVIAAAPSGEILLVNRQIAKILGRSISRGDSLETYKHFQIIHPDGIPLAPDKYPLTQAVSIGRSVSEEELEIIREDGAHRVLRVSAAPIRDRLGRIIAGAATYHDITERKQAAAEIKRLASFPRLNPSPVLEIDLKGRITYYNQAAQDACQSPDGGARPEAFLPEDLEDILKEVRERKTRRFYRELQVKDTVFAEDISYAEPLGVIRIYARDITERRQAEEAVIRAKEEWESTFDAVPDLIAIIDRNHRVVRVNRAMAAALGAEPGDLVGRPCHEIMHGSSGPPAFCPHSRLLSDGREHVEEIPVLGRDFLVSASPLIDRGGAVLGSVHVARDITDRKQAEDALRRSEAQLQTILENLTEGLVVATLDGQLFLWNRPAIKMHGFSSLEECRRRLPEFTEIFELRDLRGAVLPVAEWPLARILRGETLRDLEIHLRRLNEDWQRVFNYGGTLVRDDNGEPLLALVTVSDITERKAAELALRESQQDLKRAQAVAQTGSWRLDIRGNELVWSEETYRIFGVPQATTLTYEAFLAIVHPEDRELVDRKWQAALQGEEYDLEHRIVVGDTVKWVREKAELELDPQGTLVGGFGTVQDITGRKLAEEALREAHDQLERRVRERTADLKHTVEQLQQEIDERLEAEARLRESEARFRSTFDQSPVGVIMADLDFHFQQVNPAFCRILGYTAEELSSMRVMDVVHPEDMPAGLEKMQRFIAGEIDSFRVEERNIRKDGAVIWVDASVDLVRDSQQRVSYFIGIIQDITARKGAEARLRESEARFRATFDQSPVGALIVDLDLRFQQVNPAFSQMVGYTPEELASMHIAEVAHPDDLPENVEAASRFLAGEIDRFQVVQRARRQDGAVIWIDLSVSLIKDPSGRPSYFLAIVQDISAKKAAENYIQQQNAILNGINRVFREGLTCGTESDLGLIAISVLEELTGASMGLLYGLNPEGSLDIIAISDAGREACKMAAAPDLELPRHLPVRGLYRGIVQESISLIINQPAAHPDSIGVPEGHPPLTEFLGVPLKLGDQVTGVICLANKEGGFTRSDQGKTETLALAIAEALIRFRAEKQAVNLGRLYRLLSLVNEAIVRTQDRETLFAQICRIVVEDGGFRMAWIGLVDREECFIKAAAQHGLDEGYVETLKIPLEDAPESRGPTGTAVREGRYDVCNDFATDPRMTPWREEALSRGYYSSGAFPLKVGAKVMGAITLYAREAGFFTAEEIRLLESLAQDVSFALESMELEARRCQAEEALIESEEKLRYLTSQLIGAQEAERKRISLELHDDLGQSLTVLKLQLRGIDLNLPADWGDLRERVTDLRANLDELIEKVRFISRDLSPAMLMDLGLTAALRNLSEEFAKYHEVELSLQIDDMEYLFPLEEETNLYRIFQESLNNIAKHAQATRVAISIKKRKDQMQFSVADNGQGFDVQMTLKGEARKQGLGLATMEERVRMLGGVLKISSHKGRGTKISFAVPVRGQES